MASTIQQPAFTLGHKHLHQTSHRAHKLLPNRRNCLATALSPSPRKLLCTCKWTMTAKLLEKCACCKRAYDAHVHVQCHTFHSTVLRSQGRRHHIGGHRHLPGHKWDWNWKHIFFFFFAFPNLQLQIFLKYFLLLGHTQNSSAAIK